MTRIRVEDLTTHKTIFDGEAASVPHEGEWVAVDPDDAAVPVRTVIHDLKSGIVIVRVR